MKENKAIAIDGDSGSGKSTAGKLIGEKLGYEFVDSGLLYRAATLAIIKYGMEEKEDKWASIIEKTRFDLRNGKVIMNNEEISFERLRSKEVDSLVSPVSTVKEVRESVNNVLREIASDKNVVMVGRDIGSVVLKNAFIKIYLTANIKERANRRFRELLKKGIKISFEEVVENLTKRDIMDSSRNIAPLTVANDAYVIDTTNLSVSEVINKIMQFIRGRKYALQNNTRIS